jgi:hypothetical protein
LTDLEAGLFDLPKALLDLDIECNKIWTFVRTVPEQTEVMYETRTPEKQREVAASIMDALDIPSAVKEEDAGSASVAFYVSDGIKVFVNVPAECHKAKVVEERVITFCGELDESKYLDVAYLLDDE